MRGIQVAPFSAKLEALARMFDYDVQFVPLMLHASQTVVGECGNGQLLSVRLRSQHQGFIVQVKRPADLPLRR